MAQIHCGNCGGVHQSAGEVRDCFTRDPDAASQLENASGASPTFDNDWSGENWSGEDVGTTDWTTTLTSPRSALLAVPPDFWAGPDALGRSIVVRSGVAPPLPWADAPRVQIAVSDAAALLQSLWPRWLARERLVFELGDDFGPGTAPEQVEHRELWELGPGFALVEEELHNLIWSNSVDAWSTDTPTWHLAELAANAGATPATTDVGDVVLPGGLPAYLDGGPLRQIDIGVALVHRFGVERGAYLPLGANVTAATLAPDQLAAVTHPGGPARIIAPAGSGKTRVLTERARLLLQGWRLPPSSVTLVAFNRRAADEMVARTGDLTGLQVRTLNAVGLAILDGRPPFARRDGRLSVIDERTQRRILEGLVTLPRRVNTDPMAPWLDALSVTRLGLANPADVEREANGDLDGFADVHRRYRAALAEQGALDFDEQIVRAIEVLLSEPRVRRAAQRACRVLLVDEFQDLTPAHLLLIRLLGAPEQATFAVGDDDQTIYGYTGATPRWLIDYATLFPGAGDHPLQVNYRCPPAVVEAADRLLRRNARRVPKVISAPIGKPMDNQALRVLAGPDAVSLTVSAVLTHLSDGAQPSDIAVLTRVNASLAAVQVALSHRDIPVRKAVDEGYLNRTGVRAALAWLRLATGNGQLRGPDITETARRPARGRTLKLVEWMAEQRTVAGLRSLAGRLADRDAVKIVAYAEDVSMLSGLATKGSTEEVLRAVRDQVGLDEAMDALDSSGGALRGATQTDDLDALLALAALHPNPATFGAWLRDQLRDQRDDPEGVTLATIHSVKGREWPHVIVHEASAGLLPHRLAEDVEEERRVFHVAITRGAITVTVVPGGAPSPFVDELRTEPSAPVRNMEPGRQPLVLSAARARAVAAAAPPAAMPPTAKGEVKDPATAALWESLRAWRTQRSKADRLPAYVIFHDATLQSIAETRPTSLMALGRLSGIGTTKLERYGDEILAIVDAARS